MGGVIRRRKIATTPRNPWEKQRLVKELHLIGTYALKNKTELWTVLTQTKKDKEQAGRLLITTDKSEFLTEGRALLNRLFNLSLITGVDFNDEEDISKCLKEVLNLEVSDYLDRRLQTLVFRHGFARDTYHARSLITQKQIVVNGKVVDKPGMLVKSAMEGFIEINPNSATAGTKKGRFERKNGKKGNDE